MLPRIAPTHLVLAAGFLLAAGALRAELIKVSPFLPPQGTASTPTANAPLEYRGSLEMDNVQEYRVVDPARKVGAWLKVGEKDTNLDVVIKQHDENSDTITIDHGGQSLTLPLHVSKVVSAGGMPQMMPPAPAQFGAPNMLPAVTQSVVLNPTQVDEQRRLEAVAAEVARRRALREQAAQAVQQGAPPPAPAAVTRQDLQQAQQQQYQQGYGAQRGNRPGR